MKVAIQHHTGDLSQYGKPWQRNRKYKIKKEGIMLIVFIGDVDNQYRKSRRLYNQINRVRVQ